MISNDLLIKLFTDRIEELAAKNGITNDEKKRIVTSFKQALTNPFMDERQIYPLLTGEERL